MLPSKWHSHGDQSLMNTVPSAQPIAHPNARRIPITEICPVKPLELITPTPINPRTSPKIFKPYIDSSSHIHEKIPSKTGCRNTMAENNPAGIY